ncbi:MAG: peptide ABC transporter permease [Candidatus Rokuibacteriota bacterium]|nr:MAG: peptide ABC transporter permease [Candidatus Rokubacteria bacterium]
MLIYIARRVLAVAPVLFGVTLAVFSMLFLVPGDPVKIMLAEFVTTPEQIARMRAQLHLDEPVLQQYGRFVGNALRGDLGTSIRSRRPVTQEIGDNLASTAQLALASMAVAVALGIPLGLIAALVRNSWLDVASMGVALLGVPATGGGDFLHLVLPAVTLGAIASAIIARLTRSSMLEVLGQDYVRTARAKGLAGWSVVLRHALKNALIPVLTIFGLQFGNLLAGTVIVETVFSRPGLGRLIVGGILAKDFPLVQGTVLFVATVYVLINVIVDVAYAVADPRIRLG